ncbi:MAG: DUF4175 family protein [Chitinophagales bacterium]
MQGQNNYTILINRLDAFIRRFYLNRLIRGLLYTAAIILSAYLLFSLLEYHYFFSTTVRKIMFYSFLAGTGYLAWRFIVQPAMGYYRLGKQIDHKTAARIIGEHFSEVSDRLLNILELREQHDDRASAALIEAGIDQKIGRISSVPFQMAIDLRKNRRFLKYALPPLGVFLFILFAAPNILVDSNLRLLKNNTYFEKQAPFAFHIVNKKLEVVQYEDFTLGLFMDGAALPADVRIITPGGSYTMEGMARDSFSYRFNKVPSNTQFYFEANGFRSKTYKLEVLPKPTLLQFSVHLDYPDYTGRKDETLENSGDLQLPEGTVVEWKFEADNTDKMEMFFPEEKLALTRNNKSDFIGTKKIFSSQLYKIGIGNDKVYNNDTISYMINAIPDAYPEIHVEQYADSLDEKYFYFLGNIKDDYGFRNLQFAYKVESMDASGNYFSRDNGTENIAISKNANDESFTHAFDMRTQDLKPGDRVTYYFEIWDNDGVHGSKSARTPAMQFMIPTKDALEDIKDQNNEDIKDKLDNVLDEIQDIQKQTDKLEDKLFDKKDLNWEDKKNIEDLIKRNQDVQNQVDQLKEDFKKNLDMQEEYLEPDPELLQKEQQLEKMFDEVLPDEMKKLMEELQELLDKLNKEQGLEEMEKMNMNNEQLESELDRMLEMFKQLQLEQKMQETIDKLEELAQKQDDLSKESQEKNSKSEELEQKQEDLNKQFDDIQKDMQDMRDMNEELENKQELGDTQEQEKSIDQKMENAQQQLQQNNKKQASQNQQQSAQQMQQMAQQMQQMMQQQQMQQQQEDMRALRQLLDNLVTLSVDQESLMDDVRFTRPTDPKFTELMAQQQKIKEDTRIVNDSLNALAKRVFQISSFITRQMAEVNESLDNSVQQMGDRQVSQSNLYQQRTMTGYNELALMLDEVMQQMQQQMAQSMPGSQMCQHPGGSKESQLPSMSEMQKQLNDQLGKMKGQMEKGQQQGNKEGMSKELAEMAQKQAAIREALEKMAQNLGGGDTEDGKLAKMLQQIADQMDKTEEDIVNKRLSTETLKRQQDILTRLLEAEESERTRKMDKDRKSNTADEITRNIPPEIEEYLKKRNAELDLYKTVSPDLKPFYKNLVEEYLRSITY